MQKNSVKTIVTVALLIAVEVVLNRFCSINTESLKIGFGFVPIAVCGERLDEDALRAFRYYGVRHCRVVD